MTNKGTMNWDNAIYGGAETGTRAVINVFTTGNSAAQATTINDSTGIINLNVTSNLGNSRGIAGMAVYGDGVNSRINWENHGQININSTSNNANADVFAGSILGRTQVIAINSGTLSVAQSSGTTEVYGLGVYIRGGSTVPVSASLTNSGQILISSTTTSYAMGVQLQQSGANGSGQPSLFTLNNSGTIKLDVDPAKAVVVDMRPLSRPDVTYEITNSGSLLAQNSSGYSVVLQGGTAQTATVKLDNTGIVVGGIWTKAGNDLINQSAGSITGDLNLGAGADVLSISGGALTGQVNSANGADVVNLSSGTLTGSVNTGADNDTFTATGGAFIGNTLMGDGDDVATLTGTVDVTSAPQFDGGAGTDALNVDGLTLRGFTAASNDGTGNLTETNNSNLTGWETINVKNAGTLKLSNNLFTATNVGTLNIDATSSLDLKGNSPGIFSIYGNVNNSGMMTMADGAADDETTITGNYTGVAGSTYAIDTVLGDDNSATDKLIVNGNTSGETELLVTNVGGAGAQTINGINVVQVDGDSTEGNFTLAVPVQGGSYEYTLKRGSAIDDNDFYLVSQYAGTDCNIIGNCPTDPTKPIDIYRPAVANYVTAQSANADAGFTLLSTLHQRMGEQRGASTALTTEKAQTWGRIFAGTKEADGKNRFNYDSTISGFQFGRDLMHKTDANGTQQRAGVTVQYANNSIDSIDTVRPLAGLNADTGHTNAVSVGLGGYYTHIANDGTYFDVVTQVNHLQNTFHDAYDMRSRQKGWQFGLSGEVGKTVAHIGNWAVEPQAQLSYLYNNYSSFSDKYSHIDGFGAHNLRARLGVRLNKDEMVNGKEAQYYGIVNLHHDLLKTKAVVLHDNNGTGTASVKERFDRTSWEIGAGIQGRVGKATYLYADARYERSFKGNTSAAKVTMGVKSSF